MDATVKKPKGNGFLAGTAAGSAHRGRHVKQRTENSNQVNLRHPPCVFLPLACASLCGGQDGWVRTNMDKNGFAAAQKHWLISV